MLVLSDEVGGHDVKEFPRTDDFGFLPEFREMALVACHQIVCASCISAFDDNVVRGITGDRRQARWNHNAGMSLDQLKQLLAETFANL